MVTKPQPELSIVVPVYNEAAGLLDFHSSLQSVLDKLEQTVEIIYCNDGSRDASAKALARIAKDDTNVRVLSLSRNFGKEIATTAGIHAAKGDAIVTLDADGQHPVDLIPQFVRSWQAGNKVVIGVRTGNQEEGIVKHYGSKVFYKLFNRFTGMKLIPGSSDFRLIDRVVQQEFVRMTERNRITRGLIDWLGYQRDYIYFRANARTAGDASYSVKKLFKLSVDSVISLSLSPLYIAAYIGMVVLPLSFLLGLFMAIEDLLGDPLGLDISGGAYVLVLVLFLIGVLLMSQGIIGLYLSHIHTETQNRPLYVIDHEASIRVHEG